MAVVPPPLPYFLPDIGSVWFCIVPRGWPNVTTPRARWGTIATVTDYFYVNSQWYIRVSARWNATLTYKDVRVLPTDFDKVFSQQPILVRKAGYISGGECGIKNPLRRVSGTGRGWVGRFTEVQPLVLSPEE